MPMRTCDIVGVEVVCSFGIYIGFETLVNGCANSDTLSFGSSCHRVARIRVVFGLGWNIIGRAAGDVS